MNSNNNWIDPNNNKNIKANQNNSAIIKSQSRVILSKRSKASVILVQMVIKDSSLKMSNHSLKIKKRRNKASSHCQEINTLLSQTIKMMKQEGMFNIEKKVQYLIHEFT
jgi:hypothetical protein